MTWLYRLFAPKVPATQKEVEELKAEINYWRTLYEARDLDCLVLEGILISIKRGYEA